MTWKSFYLKPDASLWQGRLDTPPHSCFFQAVQTIDLNVTQLNTPEIKPTFALIGFRSDQGIERNLGRLGAAEGPIALRKTLARLAIPNSNFRLLDVGDIVCMNDDLEGAQAALGEIISLLLKQGCTPIVIGGGHELAWGHYQGIEKAFSKEQLGIINFDAHFDMRPLLANQQGSSGTPFLQIAKAHEKLERRFDYRCIGIQPSGNIPLLFETAKHYNVETLTADSFTLKPEESRHLIEDAIKKNKIIYTSICLDVFAAAYAPGVSAPQALGLTPWQIIPLLHQLCESGRVISYDIAELSPQYDVDERTVKLAANLIFEIIQHHRSH